MNCLVCKKTVLETDDYWIHPNGGGYHVSCEPKPITKELKIKMQGQCAIKYRPQKFSEVIGNDIIKANLSSTRTKGKIPNAILLVGHHGIGKTTMARIYAKYVNCSSPQMGENGLMEPCCQCASCQYIQSGKAFDFQEINAADHRGIDDMRNLLDSAAQGHTDLEYRIWIIDEAQQLTPQSQNILLKTLESERGKNIFIICTTDDHKILPTIASRCNRNPLRNISSKQIYEYLKIVCDKEDVLYEDDALLSISQNSDGSLRDALNLLDQCSCASQDKITSNIVNTFVGSISFDVIFYLIDNIVKCIPQENYRVIDMMCEKNVPIQNILEKAISYLNDLMVYKDTGGDPTCLQFQNNDYYMKLTSHSEKFKTTRDIRELIEILIKNYKYTESFPIKRQNHLLNLAFSECVDVFQRTLKSSEIGL